MLASLLGVPLPSAKKDAAWTSEPFGSALGLAGELEFSSKRTTFAPAIALGKLRGMLRFAESEVELSEFEGEIGGGRMRGQVLLRSGAAGLSVRSALRLTSADLLALLPAEISPNALSGRVAVQLDMEGSGLSPAAFVGSVAGNGAVVVEDLQIGSLDSRVFDAVIRAVDQGLSMDQVRVQNTVVAALDKGRLVIPWAEGTFALSNGQLRLGTMLAPALGADVNLSGRYELASGAVSLRLALAGPPKPPTPERPEIVVSYRGPLATPQRSVDASTLATWLALRSVEQQAKQLEALEIKRREALTAALPDPTPAPAIPAVPAPSTLPSGGEDGVTPRAPQAAVPTEKPAAETESAAPPAAAVEAPPLPPPVVVRPAPRPPRQVETAPAPPSALPRPRPLRPGAAPPSAAIVTPNLVPAPPPQQPPGNRNFFERLFSPQQLQN
jgi:large subunit ribosomal protein L24